MLRLFFDFISPYAYLAWTQQQSLADRTGGAFPEPVPVLFAALLDHYGHLGPAEIPPKRRYIFKHVLRLAARHGVSLIPPPSHPFNPLLALRLASIPMPDKDRRRLIDTLFEATWGGGPGVTEPETVAQLLEDRDLPGKDLVSHAGTDEVKALLRAQTDEALQIGVFGVPTVVASDGELFWGFDAFDDVVEYVAGRDPVRDDSVARWEHLPASAKRPAAGKAAQ